jgi:phosphoribosylaminoimidazolecarboxamide formyltransferase/IMP cyclohydrolase
MIKRALVSVFNKDGLEELISILKEFKIEIISSGGTARKIKKVGYPLLTEVSDYTGYPESPEGLVKTLHPKIHAGLLLNPEFFEHKKYLEKQEINSIDLVVVNLYPFEEVISKGAGLHEAAENVDIGGPTLIRSAAKASLLYDNVTVIVDPSYYYRLGKILKENNGDTTSEFRRLMAENAFKRTSEYDKSIITYLESRS